MKFLANENFPLKSVHILRNAGYDVASITEDSPGIQDEHVLRQAVREQRIILTFDRDYGELIYRRKLSAPNGVIYFRFEPKTPEETGEYLRDLLVISGITWEGNFSIIEHERMRQRSLQ